MSKVGLYEVIKEASEVGWIALTKDDPEKARVIKRAASLGYLKKVGNGFTYEATVFGESFLVEDDFDSVNGKKPTNFFNRMSHDNRVILITMVIIALLTILVTTILA